MTPSRSPRRGDAAERPLGGQPHRARSRPRTGPHRQAAVVEAGAVQVEPGDAEPVRRPAIDSRRGGEQLVGALGVGEVAARRSRSSRRTSRRVATSASMSWLVQSQISTWKPSSSMRRTRSSERQVGEDHLGADGQRERPSAPSRRLPGLGVERGPRSAGLDGLDAGQRDPRARARASSPVTYGVAALARRRRRSPRARRRRRPEEVDVAAGGVVAAGRRRRVAPVRGARAPVAGRDHAGRAEDLAAHVVAVGGGEARLGDGDRAVVEADR